MRVDMTLTTRKLFYVPASTLTVYRSYETFLLLLFPGPRREGAGEFFSIVLLIMPGDYCEGETPVPIPNTEVKPLNADGTALGWESRSSPGFFFLNDLVVRAIIITIHNLAHPFE